MEATVSLSESLKKLRKSFHLRLSKKRGLTVSEDDLIIFGESSDDSYIQLRLERLSFIRKFFIIRKN